MPRRNHEPAIEDHEHARNLAEEIARRVRELEAGGVTARQEQAALLGIGISTLHRHLSRAGMTRPSNREWIPWTVSPKHHNTAVAKNLRLLAAAAEGRETTQILRRGMAVQWAREAVTSGLDVHYGQAKGFYLTPADPKRWLLRKLLDAAMKHILGDLADQLDDLGKDVN